MKKDYTENVKALKREQQSGDGVGFLLLLFFAIIAAGWVFNHVASTNTAVPPAGHTQAIRPTTTENQPIAAVQPTQPAERPQQAQRPTQRSAEGEQVMVANTAVPLPTSTAYPTYTPYPTNTTVPPTTTPYPTYTAVPSQTPQATFTAVPSSTLLPTYTPYPTRPVVMTIITPESGYTLDRAAIGGLGIAAGFLGIVLIIVAIGYKPRPTPPIVTITNNSPTPPQIPPTVNKPVKPVEKPVKPVQETSFGSQEITSNTITLGVKPIEPEIDEAVLRRLWEIRNQLITEGINPTANKICFRMWRSKSPEKMLYVRRALAWGEEQERRRRAGRPLMVNGKEVRA